MRYFYKTIDEIEIGSVVFQDIKMDFGNIDPIPESISCYRHSR